MSMSKRGPKMQIQLPFFTLLLLISFASVNAVLFTPGLPNISDFFGITEDVAQQTITWFLLGYALGQLMYGPLANRFGRKATLYAGITLQIVSSLLCVLSGSIHAYWLLKLARFMLALGSGVGLKMTFTLVNECYEPKEASQKIAYLLLAFAITPGLGVALGGFLNTYLGWESCFYAGAIYGLILLLLVWQLPETQKVLNLNAIKIKHLWHDYKIQFKNIRLVLGGLLMGSSTCFIYIFAAFAPFIAMKLFDMSSDAYGIANCIPSIGLILGSLISAKLATTHSFESIIVRGIWISGVGVLWMFIAIYLHVSPILSLFIPIGIIYLGLCFILANASVIAMSNVTDKSHGSSVMSFINMGFATLVVFSMALFPANILLLPIVYFILTIFMLGILKWLTYQKIER